MGDGADYAEVLRARANGLADGSKFPLVSDVKLVLNVMAYIVENLPAAPTLPERTDREHRLAQYNPRRMCTCSHPLGSHSALHPQPCFRGHSTTDPQDPCSCAVFVEDKKNEDV